MFDCPVTYFEKNLIFDSLKNCWGVFQLEGYNYDFLAEESKESIHDSLTRFIAGIFDEAKILLIPIVQDTENHTKNLIRGLDPNDTLYYHAISHIEGTEQYIKELTADSVQTNDYEFFVIAKLVSENSSENISRVKSFFEYFVKDPVNAVNTVIGADTRDIMQSRVEHFERLSEEFFVQQNKRMRIHTTTPVTTQRLLKRPMYRGNESAIKLNATTLKIRQSDGTIKEIVSDWTPKTQRIPVRNGTDEVIRPFGKEVVNLFRGELDFSKPRRIKITHDDGTELFQTFLVMTHLPSEQYFPGNEWIYRLQRMNCQCEVCIHIQNIHFRKALSNLEIKKTEIGSEIENASILPKVPDELLESEEEAEELERLLKAAKTPLTKACVSIALSDRDKHNLEKKANHVKEVLSDLNFVVERPAADQLALFMQHIPGAGSYTKDFNMLVSPETLAGGIIGASNELGDNVGYFIGTTGVNEKPVYFSQGQACLENKSAAAFFAGNLGYGKSFNANVMAYLNVLLGGGYLLVFDPKGERGHWAKELPIPDELVTTVTLNGDEENAGKLDPFLVYRDSWTDAAALAVNVVSELYQLKPNSKEYIILSECIDKMKSHPNPCMNTLVELMAAIPPTDQFYDAALTLSRSVKTLQTAGITRLLYGVGGEQSIKIDNRINIIQLQNLDMPGKETLRKDYKKEEIQSVVIMMVLGNFAKQFALVPREVFSTVLFDESWMLAKTAEGLKLYEFLARMGRSLYTGCVFNGHSVLDIASEGIKETITYAFFFHSDNTEECKRMLEFLNMDITAENIQRIKGLENRECLFKDAYGRVGKVKFDCVFEELISVFTTTPKEKSLVEKPTAPVANDLDLLEYEDIPEPVAIGQ